MFLFPSLEKQPTKLEHKERFIFIFLRTMMSETALIQMNWSTCPPGCDLFKKMYNETTNPLVTGVISP